MLPGKEVRNTALSGPVRDRRRCRLSASNGHQPSAMRLRWSSASL